MRNFIRKPVLWLILWMCQIAINSVFAADNGEIKPEKLGRFTIDEINLRPTFFVREEKTAGFELGKSSITFGWQKDNQLSAVFAIGPQELLNKPVFFANEVSDDISLIEAYGIFKGPYGRFRFGLLPIQFGLDGSQTESELVFGRSLIFDHRVVGLRDTGMSYFIEHRGFYTQATVHNGEVEQNTDARVFVTSKWGWTDHENIDVGMAAHTGTTKPAATSKSKATVAGFVKSEDSQLRVASFFVNWHPNDWKFAFEVMAGELEQDSHETPFKAGYVDMGFRHNPYFSYVLRYEHFDPNYDLDKDLVKRVSLAFNFSDKYQTSVVSLIGRKNLEEDKDIYNDELLLVWRLSPAVREQ